ncbi:uncharacterized protein TRIADDRAFT_50359 [Trichoplax adhaerens]|uniref:Uncharacterized protein n=1 Tax=Trichoplax adhaerens TaxID=10228 RepID=B3S0M1_TRIAD|nr:hypothetical protein TRIADDRAFT_50359 [Trichoplax adhaerens]EDV24035.1 hypothetical protein TRIADDRAFT_50359 [Trichoplax adhaerens]|eukprot:XP_002113561.1 hypothetical protein TRIADDRAFT_50359 [Trichoplax adhaerens]
MAADGRRRVKLYVLNKDSQWDDCGTGHILPLLTDQDSPSLHIHVRSEADDSTLLESEIRRGINYQKQQNTLIVWAENKTTDLALSFQERESCDEIWNKICEFLGTDPSIDLDDPDISSRPIDDDNVSTSISPLELPHCEPGKLKEICDIISSSLHPLIRRDRLTLAIENENYISQLVDLFRMCEDLEDRTGLHYLYDIFKHLFSLNRHSLLEIMLDDGLVEGTIGCLENDPSLTEPRRHREFLRSKAKFKEVIPIDNSQLLFKIHQTYRAQFIQDVVLPTPSVFEDNTNSAISSLIYLNKVEIVTIVQNDEQFIKTLFDMMASESTPNEKRLDCARCLKELCSFSQSLQIDGRTAFFKTLLDADLIPVIELLWGNNSEQLRMNATEIFCCVVDSNPSSVRQILLQDENPTDDNAIFLNIGIEQMIFDADGGIATQFSSILRTLLDPDNMIIRPNRTEKSEFLTFFYKHCMHILIAPLLAATSSSKIKDDSRSSVLLSLILDLVSFCVDHHTYHIKNYIFRKDLLGRVLLLLKSRYSSVVLAAQKFCRQIIGLKDDFYNRYIVKGNLLEPVIKAFKMNGNRYNIFNSAVLEMFEFIRTEDIKMLCSYIIEKFWDDLKDVNYVGTFTGLKQRHDQHLDRKNSTFMPNENICIGNDRFRKDPRQLDDDEESWFNEDDDDDDTVEDSPPQLLDNDDTVEDNPPQLLDNDDTIGLVDYESDSDSLSDEDSTQNKRMKLS